MIQRLGFFQDHLREGSGTLTLTNPGGMAAPNAAADVAAASSAATYGGRRALSPSGAASPADQTGEAP